MGPLQIVILAIQLFLAVVLMLVVILQTGKNSGLGALSGSNTDSFLSKNKQKSRDARLARATKWVAGIFVLSTLVMNLI